MRRFGRLLLLLLLIGTATFYLARWRSHRLRPPRTHLQQTLFEGITYTRQPLESPRPLVVHTVAIDLTVDQINFAVTSGDTSFGREIPAQKTSQFLQTQGAQLAINGGYFEPFHPGYLLWGFYPKVGDPVDLLGLAISAGRRYSQPQNNYPVLCIGTQHVTIHQSDCPAATQHALSGNQLLLENGRIVPQLENEALHPRTAVGIDGDGQRLWLLLIDGRQSAYSEGVTQRELAKLFHAMGVATAINLDGGGSTTLAIADGEQTRLLNAPIHTHWSRRERPVGNHLGVFAQPITTAETPSH